MSSSIPPSKPPLRSAIRGYVEDERRHLGSHLEAEELVAYHERRLSEDAAERVRDHLVLCPECSDLLLDLGGLSASAQPAGAPDLTTAEVESAWREIAPRLRAAPAAVPMPRRSPVLPWALAAALLLAVVGLGARVANLERGMRNRSQLQAAVVVELEPVGEETRGAGWAVAPASSRHPVALALRVPGDRPNASYDVEFRKASGTGRVLATSRDLRPFEGNVDLLVPEGSLPPGPYRLFLYGVKDGVRSRPVEYSLDLAP